MIELFSYSLSLSQLLLLVFSAVLIGMAKTGVQGVGMIAVPLLAIAFGGKISTGILLPILIFADCFGVRHYHRHANWQHLKSLLPYALLGIVIGTLTGKYIDDRLFQISMSIIIFISVVIMVWQQAKPNLDMPTSRWFIISIGIIGGFTSMIGNLAGPVMALYLLAMHFPKNQFIGTTAWFFLVINIAKLPFHIWSWETINLNSFLLDLAMLPAVAAGAWLGVRIVQKIPEQSYRWFVIVMTAVAAATMLI